jgi:signal transduction histidine kinase
MNDPAVSPRVAAARATTRKLISTAAHQLRSPLAALSGALIILTEDLGSIGPAETELVAMMSRSVSRLEKAITDLALFAHLEHGTYDLKPVTVSLAAVAARAKEATRARAELEQVDLRMEADAAAALVADEPALIVILTQLIDNALKFSPSGGIVSVRLDADERTATFDVRDHGAGVPPEERSLLGEPFFHHARGDSAAVGAGLGLAIVQRLARLHAGALELHYPADGGVRAHVTLAALA